MKYNTYSELRSAYNTGRLNRETEPLFVDNDSCFVYTEDGEKVFGGNPITDFVTMAKEFGLPAESV